MYLPILKKDLKRKKAMNVILLVFIILASMNYILDDGGILKSVKRGEFYMTAGISTYFRELLARCKCEKYSRQRAGTLHLQTAYARDERRDFCGDR